MQLPHMTATEAETTGSMITAANSAESKICLALDGLSAERAIVLTSELAPWIYAAKIHDLYDAEGPNIIRLLKKVGVKRVWIDAKLHDTPDTVALRTRALIRNGANIVTVHAAGGIPMMKAAVEAALSECGDVLAEIWAITVLTSLSPKEVERIYGKGRTPKEIVLDLALDAREGGMKGIVCSAQEVAMLREWPDFDDKKLVVPGTRSVRRGCCRQPETIRYARPSDCRPCKSSRRRQPGDEGQGPCRSVQRDGRRDRHGDLSALGMRGRDREVAALSFYRFYFPACEC